MARTSSRTIRAALVTALCAAAALWIGSVVVSRGDAGDTGDTGAAGARQATRAPGQRSGPAAWPAVRRPIHASRAKAEAPPTPPRPVEIAPGVTVTDTARPATDEQELAALIASLELPLSREEEELLAQYDPEEMNQAIAVAEEAYIQASDEDRAAAEERYNLVLNLAAKFASPGPEPTAEEREGYQLYERELTSRADELAALTPGEAAELRQRIKEEIFAPQR